MGACRTAPGHWATARNRRCCGAPYVRRPRRKLNLGARVDHQVVPPVRAGRGRQEREHGRPGCRGRQCTAQEGSQARYGRVGRVEPDPCLGRRQGAPVGAGEGVAPGGVWVLGSEPVVGHESAGGAGGSVQPQGPLVLHPVSKRGWCPPLAARRSGLARSLAAGVRAVESGPACGDAARQRHTATTAGTSVGHPRTVAPAVRRKRVRNASTDRAQASSSGKVAAAASSAAAAVSSSTISAMSVSGSGRSAGSTSPSSLSHVMSRFTLSSARRSS